jgi:hypothetical protein
MGSTELIGCAGWDFREMRLQPGRKSPAAEQIDAMTAALAGIL